jgi:hypothetical protein
LHPALKQMEKQVDDLRRTINEEVDRFEQSAKNDLTRARDYEASLGKALDAQKRQSVQLSQAAVRLRELERDVDASRDVYQSFLKRSRETEEQETLNTSAARVIGEATVPQRRAFPPAMSLIALIGLLLGALAAAGWVIAVDRLSPETTKPDPAGTETRRSVLAQRQPAESRQPAPVAPAEKPLIARLQQSDVMRTLGGILNTGATVDVTRFGWPTLRPGFPLTTFLNTLRDIRAGVARRCPGNAMPIVAMVGSGASRDIAALNFALAASRDGARVLLIDADHEAHELSNKVNRLGKSEPSRLGWLSIGSKASRAILTANGITILPSVTGASEATRRAIAQARSAGGCDLVILDGPAMPWTSADRKLLDLADGLIAILPASLDINDSMDEIITALDSAQRKLVGVIVNELSSPSTTQQRGKQYA